MKRTSKRYVVTSDALNCYGYRVLTSGVDMTQYLINPILLWMHQRATGNTTNQILPLGRAVELQVEGDKITCALEFDETDDFAMRIYNKYENGSLNMLSLGAKPLVWSDDPADMVEGQTGLTFVKSKMTDISCVDIGGQDEACACELFDSSDKKIDLSNITTDGWIKLFNPLQHKKNEEIQNMNLIQLTGPALNGILLALKLDATATEVQVQKAVADMVQLNLDLSGEVANHKTAKDAAELQLANFKKDQHGAAIIALVDGNKNKFLPAQREGLIKLATADFESTKAYLAGLPVLQNVQERLDLSAPDSSEVGELIRLSWDDLDKQNKLTKLKTLSEDSFKAKFKQRFGTDYKG